MDIVEKYAPIFWYHEQENYLPIDPLCLVEIADLYHNGVKVNEFDKTLNYLSNLKNKGLDHWLSLPNINLGYPDINSNSIIASPKGIGPICVTEYVNELYNSIKQKYEHKIFYCINEITINSNDYDANIFSGNWKEYHQNLQGDYIVIQYFPYYLYNEFVNLHVGDWDSTVEIFINENKKWVRTAAHHYSWYTEYTRVNHFTRIDNWLLIWRQLKDNELGIIFNLNGHPFVFVALGAHGCYPTPGYSIRSAPVLDIPVAVEERKIAKKCLIYENSNATENDIRTSLDISNIPLDHFEPKNYSLVNVENEPWYKKFYGKWGNRSMLKTWDSPIASPNKESMSANKNKILQKLKTELTRGYYQELISENYHGFL